METFLCEFITDTNCYILMVKLTLDSNLSKRIRQIAMYMYRPKFQNSEERNTYFLTYLILDLFYNSLFAQHSKVLLEKSF